MYTHSSLTSIPLPALQNHTSTHRPAARSMSAAHSGAAGGVNVDINSILHPNRGSLSRQRESKPVSPAFGSRTDRSHSQPSYYSSSSFSSTSKPPSSSSGSNGSIGSTGMDIGRLVQPSYPHNSGRLKPR